MKGEAIFIAHIIEAVGKIDRYVGDLTRNDLEKDDKTLQQPTLATNGGKDILMFL